VVEEGGAKTVEYVPEMQFVHRLDMVTPIPVPYLPAWHDSQFTPDQPAGGCVCVPTGYCCHEEFQPPTPKKPALHLQDVCEAITKPVTPELGGHWVRVLYMHQPSFPQLKQKLSIQ
jgi:hypothetical protein